MSFLFCRNCIIRFVWDGKISHKMFESIRINRKVCTRIGGVLLAMLFGVGLAEAETEEQAFDALWSFVSPQGVVYDYLGELPTAKDCEECRPNAMGYWSPIENGPMFTGPFLQAMTLRAKRTGAAEDRGKCRRLAEGLLHLASVSDVPGFVSRGVGADGRCHFPVGGCDQTVPWFLGLSVYARSGLPDDALRGRIVAKMLEVGNVLAKGDWATPCEGRFAGGKPSLIPSQSLPFRGATQYLFLLRVMADFSGEGKWRTAYVQARDGKYGRPNTGDLTRLEICELGCGHDQKMKKSFQVSPGGLWIYVGCAQGCLAELAALEENPDVARRYRLGLERSADFARGALAESEGYPNVAERPLQYARWREAWTWREQNSLADAMAAANKTNANWKILGGRKKLERKTVTAPLSAAAICAYAGKYRDEVMSTLDHYDYSTIALSEFYPATLAYELFKVNSNKTGSQRK